MQLIFWNVFTVVNIVSVQTDYVIENTVGERSDLEGYNSSVLKAKSCFQYYLWSTNNLTTYKTLNVTRASYITDVISNLRWTYVDLVYQNREGYKDQECISQMLHKSNIQTTLRRTTGRNNFQLLQSLWKNRDPDIHAVVFGNVSFLEHFLHQASNFDRQSDNYGKTAMYSKSFWIFQPTLDEHMDYFNLTHSNLDNVIFIDMIEYEEPEIYTLMWRNNFSRQYERRAFRSSRTTDILEHLFPNSKFGFNGREFVSSALEWEDYLTIAEVNGKMIIDGGICAEVVKILSEALNFTHRVIKPADEKWGTLDNNGNWTGIIGQIQRKEADLSFAPLSLQSARAEVVDFTIPILAEHTSFMMRVQDPEHRKWQIYMKPYSSLVYICMLISVCSCGVCVYVFENYNTRKNYQKIRLVDTLLYFYGATILQAGPKLPFCKCSRVVICLFWIACITLAAVYCGSLVANMAVTHTENIYFNTLEDLVAQSDYKWGYNGGTFRELVFKTSRLPVYKRIHEGTNKFYKTDPDVLAIDSGVHIQKVTSEKYVYISGYNQLRKKHCEDYRFVLSPDKFLEDEMAFAFPKDSPFTEIFSKKLMQIRDSGLLSSIEKKHIELNKCWQSNLLRKEPLTIKDVQSAFYILFIGIVLSSFALVMECVIYRH